MLCGIYKIASRSTIVGCDPLVITSKTCCVHVFAAQKCNTNTLQILRKLNVTPFVRPTSFLHLILLPSKWPPTVKKNSSPSNKHESIVIEKLKNKVKHHY